MFFNVALGYKLTVLRISVICYRLSWHRNSPPYASLTDTPKLDAKLPLRAISFFLVEIYSLILLPRELL